MMRLYKSFLCLLVMSIGAVSAYTPTTWINGVPHNLYAPLCLNNTHKEKKTSGWSANLEADTFALAQWKMDNSYGDGQAYGLALNGQIHMDQVLRGLYCQVNTAALMNHEKDGNQVAQPVRHNNLVSLADTHLVLGWNAINTKRFHLSGYAFGIIPATTHSLFDSKKTVYWVGLDDHFVWGVGLEMSLRLWGKQQHHLDWLTDADVTFLSGRKKMAWARNNGIYERYQIQMNANQLYRARMALAYQYKYFTSDIGIQSFYMPNQKYHALNDASLKGDLKREMFLNSLFCDVGTVIKFCNLSSHTTLGAQVTGDKSKFHSWSANLKFGITF